MTSYTSANQAPSVLKSALAYLVASLLCAAFSAIYEAFSHGVYSYFMIYAFAIPLTLGALPNLVVALTGRRAPGKLAANVWNSGVATLTVGSLFQGALDIYGTTSRLVVVYPVVAAILLAAGAVFHLRTTRLDESSLPRFMQRAFRANAEQTGLRGNRPNTPDAPIAANVSVESNAPGKAGASIAAGVPIGVGASGKVGGLSPCTPYASGEAGVL